MGQETLVSALNAAFGAGGRSEKPNAKASAGLDMATLSIDPADVLAVFDILKNDAEFSFEQLSYVTATDESDANIFDLHENAKEGTPRFRIVYFLYSFKNNVRVKVETRVAESDEPVIESCTKLFAGANWMEREIFDMFGIRFSGHPELRRILMPEEYIYFPLRKDFPLEGIEPDRLYRNWESARAAEHGADSAPH
ncbi:MAG: NADH-quinone oxidoreductase subunit C [Planctomycetota bacterium]